MVLSGQTEPTLYLGAFDSTIVQPSSPRADSEQIDTASNGNRKRPKPESFCIVDIPVA
jgi:hypothetical protein